MNTQFQNYLIVLFVVAVLCSALLAHTMIPLVGILGGFVASMLITRFAAKKQFNTSDMAIWKKYGLAGLVALVGSQMGWAALLI